jgi:SAM-dependent methyltransferase
MNAGLKDEDPSFYFYESDYPGLDQSAAPETLEDALLLHNLESDVRKYREIAIETGGPILELCCGAGRVAIPLAKDGLEVTGVDYSGGMLEKFNENLSHLPAEVASRISLFQQDVCHLDLEDKSFNLALLPFNSLLCIPDFELQCSALRSIADHLAPKAALVVDVINPFVLNPQGEPIPRLLLTRKHIKSGNLYSKFGMLGPLDGAQCQKVFGWYDEIDNEGRVKRYSYSYFWRVIFRFELELMLNQAGFSIEHVNGGYFGGDFTAQSVNMVIQARKR